MLHGHEQHTEVVSGEKQRVAGQGNGNSPNPLLLMGQAFPFSPVCQHPKPKIPNALKTHFPKKQNPHSAVWNTLSPTRHFHIHYPKFIWTSHIFILFCMKSSLCLCPYTVNQLVKVNFKTHLKTQNTKLLLLLFLFSSQRQWRRWWGIMASKRKRKRRRRRRRRPCRVSSTTHLKKQSWDWPHLQSASTWGWDHLTCLSTCRNMLCATPDHYSSPTFILPRNTSTPT